jgi:hypothetical protein
MWADQKRTEQAFRISVKGPFSLAASTQFLEGFTPAAYPGGEPAGYLHLAFPVEPPALEYTY